jgi:hypothetical protein
VRSRPRGRLQGLWALFLSLARFEGGRDFGMEGSQVFRRPDGEPAEDFQQRVDVGAGSVEGGHGHVGAGVGSASILRGGIDGHDPLGGKLAAKDLAIIGAPEAGGFLLLGFGDRGAGGEDGFEARDGLG